jgi:hypothetical protein
MAGSACIHNQRKGQRWLQAARVLPSLRQPKASRNRRGYRATPGAASTFISPSPPLATSVPGQLL